MRDKEIGRITKITGSKVLIRVAEESDIRHLSVNDFSTNYISIGSLIGTWLVDGRVLAMTVEEIYDSDTDIFITASISGIYDDVTEKFSFGTNTYPLVGEFAFKLKDKILSHIFGPKDSSIPSTIGTYIYNDDVCVGYDADVLFGKHLGVFGNTGSGKTCTVVSIVQNYIRNNPHKDIKFIILDVNGEYKHAFKEDEAEYIAFDQLRFHHSILSNPEYGRLFRAAEGVQYPALKDCISTLKLVNEKWDLEDLSGQIDKWINEHTDVQNGKKSDFSRNQISGYLRTMCLRIDAITEDTDLMRVINSADDNSTLNNVLDTDKKVIILDLQVSNDSLDIVVYMLFKAIYEYKSHHRETTHLNLVLEEAHNLLRKTSMAQSQESSNLQGKSVEMLTNAIAEMRTYGEGFIISDQAPDLLDDAVIRNTNTKLVFRLPDETDCERVGKSIALKPEQIRELAKLPAFVAAVYQNDWVEAVLCKSERFDQEKPYSYQPKDTSAYLEEFFAKIFLTTEKVEFSAEKKAFLTGWISGLYETHKVKSTLMKVLEGDLLSEQEKLEIAYNLFEGKRIALILNAASDTATGMEQAEMNIRSRYSFTNDELSDVIRKYILGAINSIKECSEISRRYQYFGLIRRGF